MRLQSSLSDYQQEGVKWLLERAAGILAFAMGLGKTVTVLAAIFQLFREKKLQHRRILYICPKSVIPHVVMELHKHIEGLPDGAIFVYHGEARKKRDKRAYFESESEDLRILITSYDTLMHDLKNATEENPSFLLSMRYDAAIADEAHLAANPKTSRSKALVTIAHQSDRRWIMTGTPWQNNRWELAALAYFMDVKPYSLRCFWEEYDVGSAQVSDWVRQYILFCSKKKLKLPPMTREERNIPLLRSEKEIYLEVAQDAIQAYAQDAEGNRLAVWPKIMMLRQTALCASLVTHKLQDLRERNRGEPPAKRRRVEGDTMLEGIDLEEFEAEDEAELEEREEFIVETVSVPRLDDSSRTAKIIELINQHATDEKIVVFSQWRTYLDHVKQFCSHGYRELHGGLSLTQRKKVVDDLFQDPSTRVLFSTIKAGSVGINLSAASVVINCDLGYNPVTELQAHDRVHRIGQTRPVKIYSIWAQETIDMWVKTIKCNKVLAGRRCLGSEEYLADCGGNSPDAEQVERLFKRILPQQIRNIQAKLERNEL